MTKIKKITTQAIGQDLVAIMPVIHKKLLHFLYEGIESNLSHFHFAILGMLHKSNALPVSEIGRCLLISKPQMTVILDKLVDVGLVSRSQSSQDRRIVYISITPEGEKVLVQAREKIKKNMEVKLANLTEADLLSFSGALKTISEISSKIE